MSLKPLDRPLSPHLQIWKWTFTMAVSILHRMTGAALAFGLLVVVWGVFALASGPSAYETFRTVASSWIGQLALLGWTFALYLHIGTGIRHLLMDSGYLISIPHATRAGQVIIASSVILTAATWLCVLTCTASN